MKKVLMLLLALLLVFSLAACGKDAEELATEIMENAAEESAEAPEKTPEEEPAEEPVEAPAEEPAEEPTEAPTEEPAEESTENTAKEQAKEEAEQAAAGSMEEITVVDNEACIIKITGIDPDGDYGYTLNAYFENKSADKTYMFAVDSAAVNGVESDPFFAAEVAAGKKSNEEISFDSEELAEIGITEFTDIELSFDVYDSDDWSADSVAEETIHIYPLGQEKAVPFVREAQPNDQVLVDNDFVTVIVTGYEEDGFWGYTVNLFLVNKTDAEVTYSADNVSVNGYMIDPYYASSVGAGKCAFSSISWSLEDLEANGITTVEEIEMTLTAYNSEDWSVDDYVNETVTITP